MSTEDLRQHYITPLYLATMAMRARDWSPEFIRIQIAEFERTIPDYPEVKEILEAELYTRTLNEIHNRVRKTDVPGLRALLKEFASDPDVTEIVRTEMELRQVRGSK